LENSNQKSNPGNDGNSNPNSSKPNPGAETKNNFITVETQARRESQEQSKKAGSELTRLLNEAKNKNTYEELVAIIKEIDEYEGEEEYEINHKSEIQALKN